ncbi:MAG TPA: asparagine synthase (glutamine-hydrolyzing) [Gemmatimonadaceae bacterium]
MCGICGIALSAHSTRQVDRRQLERMREVLTHRGPDDCGLFLENGIGFGHRRLSIIDVAAGHQPMGSDDASLQIVYNGEVYNHAVLRGGLEARGVRFRTRCDTETVLRMYEAEGAQAPRQLRGMFAFAVWDRRNRELFLARDRLGVKPLYYVLDEDGSLYFASEIKALLAAGAVTPALNTAALPDYLANHAPSGTDTLFQGIRRLPPGCTLTWKDGEVDIQRYWAHRFCADGGTRRDADLIEEYGERFADSVRMRLMSDVPLGVFLSGGIDSAAITATMSRFVDEPIKTFSVAFAEREANELSYARAVAERFRTDHHEIVVSPEQFFGALPKLVWHEDEPLAHPSSIALYFVSRLAAEHVKVVLTGEGSDETLAGYGRYRITKYNVALGQRYERFVPASIRDRVRRVIDGLPRNAAVRQKLSRTFLQLPAELRSLYFDNFSVFSRSQQLDLLAPAVRERLGDADPYARQQHVFDASDARSLLNRLLDVDINTYLHELLMKQDQMSMAASIESRVPFLDHPLVEFAAALPERLKLRGLTTKYVLRQAMRDVLPPEIISRKKMGFPVPIASWFRDGFRGIVDEFVLGDRARARGSFDQGYVRQLVERHRAGENHSERLWALINFEIWQRLFLDGELAEDIAPPALALPASGANHAHILT